MENIITHEFEKFERLLKNKKINQLTQDEKQFALSVVSEQEYETMSAFYANVNNKSIFTEIEPQISTKTKLNNSFNTSKNRILPIYLRKIPFYQTAAVALICMTVGFWVNFSVGKLNDSNKTAQNIVRDTIQVIQYMQSPSVYLPLTIAQNQILSQAGLKVINNEKDLFVDTLYHVTNNVFVTNKNQRTSVQKLFQKSAPNNDKNLYADTLLKKMLIVLY